MALLVAIKRNICAATAVNTSKALAEECLVQRRRCDPDEAEKSTVLPCLSTAR